MKASVSLLTYNHEPFIAQAIESVLMQQVDFDHELVIGEDCSTDATRRIILGYQSSHPATIRLLPTERNLGMNTNFARTLQACRGQYIALLDGDDYWTSPYKLQKQVEFLDRHPECSICFHNVEVIYEDGSSTSHEFHLQDPIYRMSRSKPKAISTLGDLVAGNFMQTCSVMFRSGLFGDLPEWIHALPIGDWPLHILNAQHGDIGYLDEVLAAYRVHAGGVWSMNLSRQRTFKEIEKVLTMFQILNRHLDFAYDGIMRKEIAELYSKAARALYREQQYRRAADYARTYLSSLPVRERLRRRRFLGMMLKGYLPPVHAALQFVASFLIRSPRSSPSR